MHKVLKTSLVIFLTFSISVVSNGQDVKFNEAAFSNWNPNQKKARMFEIFEEDSIPSDDKLYEFFGKLIKSGDLDVSLRSKNNKQSLFDVCVLNARYKTARLLLENGYNPNQRCFDCQGETSFHKVIMLSGRLKKPSIRLNDLMLYMLQNGADPDLRDIKGDTPLHTIMQNKDEEAFNVFMHDSVTFNAQLGTLKGVSYLIYFDKQWNDDELREALIEKTELKYPPTQREIRNKQKEQKEKQKEDKKSKKGAKKEKKETNPSE